MRHWEMRLYWARGDNSGAFKRRNAPCREGMGCRGEAGGSPALSRNCDAGSVSGQMAKSGCLDRRVRRPSRERERTPRVEWVIHLATIEVSSRLDGDDSDIAPTVEFSDRAGPQNQ